MKQTQGFTLIEIILYVGIVGIMSTALIQVYLNIIALQSKSQVIQEVNDNLRYAADRLNYQIRQAKSINSIGTTGISLNYSNAAYNPTVFDISGGHLRLGIGVGGSCPASSPCEITSNLVNLVGFTLTNLFSGDSKTLNIKYSLTGSYLNPGGRSEYAFSQTINGSAELRSK